MYLVLELLESGVGLAGFLHGSCQLARQLRLIWNHEFNRFLSEARKKIPFNGHAIEALDQHPPPPGLMTVENFSRV